VFEPDYKRAIRIVGAILWEQNPVTAKFCNR
jgi:hypothetical protein